MRIFSTIAGAAALAAAVGRFVVGQGELDKLMTAVGPVELETLIAVVWHAMTYAMALIGAALIASARASREVAVAVAMLACAFFGGVVAIMAVNAGARIGDPLAFYPVYVLAAVAALSGVAAARA